MSFEIKPTPFCFGLDAVFGFAFGLGLTFPSESGKAVGATVCTAARSTATGFLAVTTSSSSSSELVMS